jgi:hypothetical protein
MPRLLALALLFVLPFAARAGSLADVELYDRTANRFLPVHEHRGQLYVAGEPGHQYEIRVRNRSQQRVLAVTSVDGVNVISGQTAATSQQGYVLDRWDSVSVDGWRKNMDEVATFYFTALPDSYAARTGRPDNVGVIGVALFRERIHRPSFNPPMEQRAEAPAARSQSGDAELSRQREDAKLGTGHGQRESSPAQYVDFRRESATPDEMISIYYDSYRNLVAQGVLPRKRRPVKDHVAVPFPASFVPDP